MASYPMGTATVKVISPYSTVITESSSDTSRLKGDHTNQVMMTLYKQIASADSSQEDTIASGVRFTIGFKDQKNNNGAYTFTY